jgi:hypothetical protein
VDQRLIAAVPEYEGIGAPQASMGVPEQEGWKLVRTHQLAIDAVDGSSTQGLKHAALICDDIAVRGNCVAGSFSDRRQQFPRHGWHEARAFSRTRVSMRCCPSPGIITPKPAHSRRENGCSVFGIVGPSPHDQLIVIAFES